MFYLPQNRKLGRAYQFIIPAAAAVAGLIWGTTGALWDAPVNGESNNNLLVASGLVIMMTFFGALQGAQHVEVSAGTFIITSWLHETTYRDHDLRGVVVRGVGHVKVLLDSRSVTLRWTPTRLFYFIGQDDPDHIESSIRKAYGSVSSTAEGGFDTERFLAWRFIYWAACLLGSPIPFLMGSGIHCVFS